MNAYYQYQHAHDSAIESRIESMATNLEYEYLRDTEKLSEALCVVADNSDFMKLFLAYRFAGGERKHSLGFSVLEMMNTISSEFIEKKSIQDATAEICK